MPTSAIEKLRPSRLATASQMQTLGGDLDIDEFHMQIRRGTGIDVVSAIVDAVVERTMEGASTLTVTVDDDEDRTIQKSGDLGKRVDVNVDGLWWTLAAVKKQSRQLTLTFEEREVNLLRRYNKPLFADRTQITRAQFVLRMIREVQEVQLKWIIPELHIRQLVSDVSQNQILVGPDGKPISGGVSVSDATTASAERQKGISRNAKLTVRGARATPEQIKNADIILNTGESMKANRKVLISSMMTAIDESNIRNLPGGDRDSRGVFQQRPSSGWPASRNVAVDAAAYFKEAIRADQDNPHLSIQMLCQVVQRSGTPDGSNYAAFISEGTAFVDQFDRNPSAAEQSLFANSNSAATATNMFMRGQITKARGMTGAYLLTPENSWNCMQRLATEVNWRAFCVSGVIYFISEHWLFKSKPFMTISEDTPGIDWINYDYDEGKPRGSCEISAHISRWSAPPGSVVELENMGPVDGKWLVLDVSRSLYNNDATITLEKPLPLLPEPVALAGVPSGFGGAPKPGGPGKLGKSVVGTRQDKIVSYARSQLGVPYQWGAEHKGVAFDCSGLAQAACLFAGIQGIPRVAQAQYDFGVKLSKVAKLEPGDLVYFGGSVRSIEHVGIYIGNGTMIDAPHTGARVRVDKNFFNWTNPEYVGASRPWQK